MSKKGTKKKRNGGATSRGSVGKLFTATGAGMPADVTEEMDWGGGNADIRLARVFTIVLILHVVAVGGILAFKMIEKASAPGGAVPEMAEESEGAQPAAVAEPGRDVPVEPAKPDPLIMTDPAVAGIRQYRVQRGDTLESIAKAQKLNIAELRRLNQLHVGERLYPGQWIALPEKGAKTADAGKSEGKAPPAPKAKPVQKPNLIAKPVQQPKASKPQPKPAAAAPAAGKGDVYVVKSGDTLYGISRQFGITFQELMEHNGITKPESLQVGARLKIPAR